MDFRIFVWLLCREYEMKNKTSRKVGKVKISLIGSRETGNKFRCGHVINRAFFILH